jgi:hypothetical protein
MKKFLIFFAIFTGSSFAYATDVNLRTAPVSDLSGFPTFNFDFDTGHSFTLGVGAGITVYSFGGTSPSASEFNINAVKYFADKSFKDAFFIGAIAEVTNGSIHTLGLTENQPTLALGGRAGYQWMWSAFNIQLASVVLSSPSYLTIGIDFTIGWLIN